MGMRIPLSTGYDFNYTFLDSAFSDLYKSDTHVGRLFNCFAGVPHIVALLSKDFVVLVAAAIAFPVAWYGADRHSHRQR